MANGDSWRSPPTPARSNSSLPTSSRRTCWKRSSGPVFGHIANTFIDRSSTEPKPSTRGDRERPGRLGDAAPAGRRRRRSGAGGDGRGCGPLPGIVAQYGLDPATLRFARHGVRATADALVAEGDRVEITRALLVDPGAGGPGERACKAPAARVPRAGPTAPGNRQPRGRACPVAPNCGQCAGACLPFSVADLPSRCSPRALLPSRPRSPRRGERPLIDQPCDRDGERCGGDCAALCPRSRFRGARPDRHPLQVGWQFAGNGPGLQRTRPLRFPAGDRRLAAADRERA